MTTLLTLLFIYLSGSTLAWLSEFTIASNLHWSARVIYVIFWPFYPVFLIVYFSWQWLHDNARRKSK